MGWREGTGTELRASPSTLGMSRPPKKPPAHVVLLQPAQDLLRLLVRLPLLLLDVDDVRGAEVRHVQRLVPGARWGAGNPFGLTPRRLGPPPKKKKPSLGETSSPPTFFLHHFGRALLEDGVGLDDLGPAPAPAMPIALPVPLPLLLLLLDGDIFSGPGHGGGRTDLPYSPPLGTVAPSPGTFGTPNGAGEGREMLTMPLTLP